MLQRIALFALLTFALPAQAVEILWTAGWTAPTVREDGKAITGAITYQLWGGDPGTPLSVLANTAEVSATGTFVSDGNSMEFYIVACENSKCSVESPRIVKTGTVARIGQMTSLVISVEFQ